MRGKVERVILRAPLVPTRVRAKEGDYGSGVWGSNMFGTEAMEQGRSLAIFVCLASLL